MPKLVPSVAIPSTILGVVAAINALVAPSELEIAAILSIIRGKVVTAGWSHTDAAKYTIEEINDAIYYLNKQGELE